MEEKRLKQITQLVQLVLLTAGAAAFVWLTIKTAPLLLSVVREPEKAQLLQARIEAMGWKGVAAVLAVQVIQVFVALIPGEPVEFMAGVMYGPWGGLLLCLIGIVLGTLIIFFLVRKIGRPVVSAFISHKDSRRFAFLEDEDRLYRVIFVVFFLPGTPKDALTYIAALTSIPPSHFLMLTLLARLPSLLSSTVAGATFGKGNFLATLLIYGITALVGLVGIHYKDKILEKWRSHWHKKQGKGF